ncbi:MAG: DUF742 domain-containing protein [Ilumatobacteraceae bacterium]
MNQSTSAAPASVVEDLDVTGEVGGPYFLTRGRTTSYSEDITFETMVVVADLPSPHIHALRFEERQLVELCRYEPQSVRRSPEPRLPIAVARVLCGDLSAWGARRAAHLPMSSTTSS